jgi:hypothetical protein
MAINLDYPAAWSDATMQPDEDIHAGLDMLVVQGEVSEAQLAAIQSDNRYPVLISGSATETPADLTTQQRTALRAELAAVVHPDVARLAAEAGANPVTIADALIEAVLHKPFRAGVSVKAGEVYQFERNLYEVVQAHKTQSDWPPTVARSLWKRWYNPDNEPEAWVQPLGAHDAYRIGQRVTFGGFTWQNTIAANVWQPGVTGWTNLTPPPPVSAWVFPAAYKVNDEVTYQGNTYRCRQAHTSQAAWTPTAVPALWLRI